ncbi:MAG: hypothetical protein E7256_16795 [Lachnospiraceae bacterium]|nr:hypothetical protein [Lachnospiraceae bacterium]
MRYCKTCHITYRTPLKNCMFCNNPLSITNNGACEEHYPELETRRSGSHLFSRTTGFLFLLANLFCLSIDFFIAKPRIHWSLLVLGACLFFVFSYQILKGNHTGISRFMSIFLLLVAEVVSIGFIVKSPAWAIDYVFPFCILFLTCFMTCFLLGDSHRVYDYGIYVLSSALLGLIPFFLLIFGKLQDTWPSISCSIFSAIILLGLFFFTPRAAKEELKRRFYL